jgi:hypothetical protein
VTKLYVNEKSLNDCELRIERDEVGGIDRAHGSQMKSDINTCGRIILKCIHE